MPNLDGLLGIGFIFVFIWFLVYTGMSGFLRARRVNTWASVALAVVLTLAYVLYKVGSAHPEVVLAVICVIFLVIAFWPRRR